MPFTSGSIDGVVLTHLQKFTDERGWLAELFRVDELDRAFHPAMAYASISLPGVLRGPHEHVSQADLFCWFGPGSFKVTLWDNREGSPSFGHRMELLLGAERPGSLLVPRGVVHCYRCISPDPALVINCPNRLFKGAERRETVDEIRHEDDPGNPFVLDELERRALS